MKVLVTGATSLLGRHVALQLAARGEEVTCFQRRPSATGLREVLGDVRDGPSLRRAAAGQDAVVHLAALVAPRAAWTDAYAVNVGGTENALAAAREAGALVHVSTPSVAFHDVPAIGLGAEPPTYDGPDPYPRSKALAEQLVLQQTEVPASVLRPHLVWGPGDTQLVGRILDRARAGQLVLIDHGQALIDTTFVDDAAAAIVSAVDRTRAGSELVGRPWVVSGADPRPVRDLLCGIVAAAGLTVRLRSVPAPLAARLAKITERLWRGDEPPITSFAARQLSVAHWFDQRAVQRVLGWQPQVSVDEGLARLAASFAEQPPPE